VGGESEELSKVEGLKVECLKVSLKWLWRLVSCQLVLLTAVVTAALKLLKDFNGIIMMLVVQLFV
jgi:hypothetical protein